MASSSGLLRRVALVRTDVSEKLSVSLIRMTRIGELGTLAVTSNRRTLRRRYEQSISICGKLAVFLENSDVAALVPFMRWPHDDSSCRMDLCTPIDRKSI
jgi:hypothetical protein